MSITPTVTPLGVLQVMARHDRTRPGGWGMPPLAIALLHDGSATPPGSDVVRKALGRLALAGYVEDGMAWAHRRLTPTGLEVSIGERICLVASVDQTQASIERAQVEHAMLAILGTETAHTLGGLSRSQIVAELDARGLSRSDVVVSRMLSHLVEEGKLVRTESGRCHTPIPEESP